MIVTRDMGYEYMRFRKSLLWIYGLLKNSNGSIYDEKSGTQGLNQKYWIQVQAHYIHNTVQ